MNSRLSAGLIGKCIKNGSSGSVGDLKFVTALIRQTCISQVAADNGQTGITGTPSCAVTRVDIATKDTGIIIEGFGKQELGLGTLDGQTAGNNRQHRAGCETSFNSDFHDFSCC